MGSDSEENQNKIENNIEGSEVNVQGDAYFASNNEQSAKKVNYKGEKKDTAVIEKLSITLNNNFSDLQVGSAGIISLIASFITIWGFIEGIGGVEFPQVALYLGIGLAMVGSVLLGALQYKKSRKCSECGELYSMKEHKDPDIEEIEKKHGTKILTTRYFKCQKCGHEEEKTSEDFEKDEDEELEI